MFPKFTLTLPLQGIFLNIFTSFLTLSVRDSRHIFLIVLLLVISTDLIAETLINFLDNRCGLWFNSPWRKPGLTTSLIVGWLTKNNLSK